MRQVILIARDDDGQPCSNEAWAEQVRYLAGVEHVDVLPIDTVIQPPGWPCVESVRFEDIIPNSVGSCPGYGGTIAINVEDGAQRFPATVGGPVGAMMFASTKPSEVDAYVARQAERMGHTEVTRG